MPPVGPSVDLTCHEAGGFSQSGDRRRSNVDRVGRLVHNDEAFTVSSHFGNSISEHFDGLRHQVGPFGTTIGCAASEDVVSFFEHGDML